MKAHAGDRLVVRGRRVGDRDRVGVVVEARGAHGDPPFLVRWSDDDHEALLFPGPDTHIEPTAASTDA